MMKFKNSKKTGRWLLRAGSRHRMFRVRSRKPGKWTMKIKQGTAGLNKMKKMNKPLKMRKMRKMAKMQKLFDIIYIPKPHLKRKLKKAKKFYKVARLPKVKVKRK